MRSDLEMNQCEQLFPDDALLKVVQVVPGEEAYPPASESACSLLPKAAQ